MLAEKGQAPPWIRAANPPGGLDCFPRSYVVLRKPTARRRKDGKFERWQYFATNCSGDEKHPTVARFLQRPARVRGNQAAAAKASAAFFLVVSTPVVQLEQGESGRTRLRTSKPWKALHPPGPCSREPSIASGCAGFVTRVTVHCHARAVAGHSSLRLERLLLAASRELLLELEAREPPEPLALPRDELMPLALLEFPRELPRPCERPEPA